MIIRDVNLETVCGVTSKLPDNTLPEFAFCRKIKCGKILFDQCPDEQESLCKDVFPAWKDADH